MKTSFNRSRLAWRIKSTQMLGQISLGTRVHGKAKAENYNRRKENCDWRKEQE